MHYIRPICMQDLDGLYALAGQATSGLTTLPPDKEVLRKKILRAQRSFAKEVDRAADEAYVFVLVDNESGHVCGICGIEAKTGGYEPFYAYRIEDEIHHSEQLDVTRNIQVLKVYTEHNGPSEVCSLFLSPRNRKKGSGRLLSFSRFMFMAEFPQRFEEEVIAEMRGVINDEGGSPFWRAIAKHFIDMPLAEADYLSLKDKHFIGELMPRHPIYVPLLPAEARAVMGEVHVNTRPALALLQSQGFHKTDLVDIFEAGPVVRARCEDIACIQHSRCLSVQEIVPQLTGTVSLISNRQLDIRVVLDAVDEIDGDKDAEGSVRISQEAAQILQVQCGDTVRVSDAYPQT